MGYQLDKRQFEILDMLVRFNTESPPGRNTDPLQDEIETLLKQLDFSIQREQLYDNDSVIVATKQAPTSMYRLTTRTIMYCIFTFNCNPSGNHATLPKCLILTRI